MASPALLLPWARAPLPLQVSSNFGQQRTATPLSQLGLAITQGMAGAQKIHAAGPFLPAPSSPFFYAASPSPKPLRAHSSGSPAPSLFIFLAVSLPPRLLLVPSILFP